MTQMQQALKLLEHSEGFIGWLQSHKDEIHDNTILTFFEEYLRSEGIHAQLWMSTWPPMEIADETVDLTQHWIVNLQQYFGQRLTRPVSGQEILESITDNPSTYSLIKNPPGYLSSFEDALGDEYQ